MLTMAMNYVTFNQDFTQLAVGEHACALQEDFAQHARYNPWLSHLFYRPVRKDL